jgi:dienelactone hydrolase
MGRFVPGEVPRSPLIWDADADVHAAHEYLKSHSRIAADRIGVGGASYSGEEMAEAGRLHEYAQAYVALSPGSFSEETVLGIDASGVPWLFVVSRDDRFLGEITASVQRQSKTAELLLLPAAAHATDIFASNPDVAERIATWFANRLR